ncbi:hypothetical protein PVA45_05360 [Entomospira entomophila]|uniref:Endoribonuclease VapD n=1 Tax=Entomospira entomophila TaxID=2719988 RepID=A0A968GAH9_9SPIO|nr:virulence factor [Entomospira entomophilus]NIZ40927.1 virulence factor [Entomospira entomophilus]WDI35140.1 hypothetical protein PVA45_05360 [Entomospira entomophilus]
MYAITFDLEISDLERLYPGNSYHNAYAEIKNFLATHGFKRQQGSVYFGDDGIDAVKTVMAVNKMSAQFPWLKGSVSDIRMLRIEENNDLAPAL